MRPGQALSALAAERQERVRGWIARLGGLLEPGVDAQAPPAAGRPSFEELILGGPLRYTWSELVGQSGLDPEHAARLWRSLGLAEVGPDVVAFTDSDLAAMRRMEQASSRGLVPGDVQFATARPIGQAMVGLADWQVEALNQMLPAPTRDVDVDQIHDTVTELLALLDEMQNYVWRRHLAVATNRLLASHTRPTGSRSLVVGFADMVGFTAATRRLPLPELRMLVDGFQELAVEAVVGQRGRVVKTVGDEVLFVADHASDAAEIALGLIERVAREPELPELRIGLAAGPVLARFGDVYGEVVNIASRLTSNAKPGRILVDEAVAEALRADPRYRVRFRRPLRVRGYNHLRSWGLTRGAAAGD